MATQLAAVQALITKDVRQTVRNPLFLFLSLLVPTLFVGIFALVIRTSAVNPVAVANEADGSAAGGLEEVIQGIHSVEGQFYRVLTTDPMEARRLYNQRDVPAVIEIPNDFSSDLNSRGARVPIRVFNIDSDGTKNLHLRLEHALRAYNRHTTGGGGMIGVSETTVFARELPMSRYFGTALLMFAVIYLAMVNTGTLLAEEWERGTVKGVVLSPEGLFPFIAGKWLGALLLGGVGLVFVLAVLIWLLGYPVANLDGWAWLYLTLFGAYGSAIGALLGVKLQSSLLIVPASAVISITHLLLCGFESYTRGFSHEGVLLVLWGAGSVWPVSSLTDEIRRRVEGLPIVENEWFLLPVMLVLVVILVAIAVGHLRTRLVFTQGM